MPGVSIGERYGRLVVTAFAQSTDKGRARVTCTCDCGGEKTLLAQSLKSGGTQSCGCLWRENGLLSGQRNQTHGHAAKASKVYKTWKWMHARCRENGPTQYWGRGIRVCEHWHVFENFLEDMGEPPTPKHSIDRIDNDGNYEPGNCRWALQKQQTRNRRGIAAIEYGGQAKSYAEWAELSGIFASVIRDRIARGWIPADAIWKPMRQTKLTRKPVTTTVNVPVEVNWGAL